MLSSARLPNSDFCSIIEIFRRPSVYRLIGICFSFFDVHFFKFIFNAYYSHVKQPTAEQIRIAQITEISTGSDDPKMREKVANLMEMTQRTEEEVCCALYECDNDMERAVEFLLETLPVVSILAIRFGFSLSLLKMIFGFDKNY